MMRVNNRQGSYPLRPPDGWGTLGFTHLGGPVPQAKERLEGSLIAGKYRVLGRLGSGGMGDVDLARDEVLDREVAIKFLRHRGDPDARRSFVSEARVLAAVRHPSLVMVFDFGLDDDLAYLVMEYIDGRRLGAFVTESDARRREIFGVVAKAVAALHRAGFCHGDLKPSNVLVEKATGRIVLVDLGLVYRPDVRDTHHPVAIGTARYMAPELLEGDTPRWGKPADVYAFGLLGAQLWGGREAVVPSQTTVGRVAHRWTVSWERLDQVPEDIRQLLRCATDEAPEKRCTIDEIVARLSSPG